MEPAGLFLFASALLVAAVSPGPGITALVARVLGRGAREAIPFSVGMAAGSVVWLTCSVVGLAALAQTLQWIFLVIRYVGAAYLLFLAYKLWAASPTARDIHADERAEHPGRLFLGGLAVTLSNPKSIMFYLALVPTFVDVAQITVVAYLELAVTVVAVLGLVFAGYILLAVRARRLFTSPKALSLLNKGAGIAMAGAAATIAVR